MSPMGFFQRLNRKKILESIYKRHFFAEGLASPTTEEIHKTLNRRNVLVLEYGVSRIEVKLPKDIAAEIREFSKPIKDKERGQYYGFDYLTVSVKNKMVYNDGKYVQKKDFSSKDFLWIVTRTTEKYFSEKQKEMAQKTKIGYKVSRLNIKF